MNFPAKLRNITPSTEERFFISVWQNSTRRNAPSYSLGSPLVIKHASTPMNWRALRNSQPEASYALQEYFSWSLCRNLPFSEHQFLQGNLKDGMGYI